MLLEPSEPFDTGLPPYQMVILYGEHAGERYDIVSWKDDIVTFSKSIRHIKTPLERSIKRRIAQEAKHANLPS